MSVSQITSSINNEDQTVSLAIKKVLPQIDRLIEEIVAKMKQGGRLFYVGAGSGGRLSVLDAIELPTTFGIEKGLVNVILAGGAERLLEALEDKEDDIHDGWAQLEANKVSAMDMVVGISASGTTPFVLTTLEECRRRRITTGCIVSNPKSPIADASDCIVEVITGPEFLTGSTRMKCGTAQKMILDIISTTTMIQLGKVEDNSMVNVKLINDKIIDRGVKMLMQKAALKNYAEAKSLLLKHGSVKKAFNELKESERT